MLKCNKNGDFTILVVSDPQCEEKYQWQEAADELETLVQKSNPDYVIINGDMETNNQVTETGWDTFVKPLTARGIFWSTTNGNHDPFSEEINNIYTKYDTCLNKTVDVDDEFYESDRPLNYVYPVYSNDGNSVVFAVYGMDSGVGNHPDWEGYTKRQINWYKRESNFLKAQNSGTPVASLMCCHIPFEEVAQMNVICGIVNEEVTMTCTANNRGTLDAIIEQGDVKIAVFGHSHSINHIGIHKGIYLSYAGKVSSGSYHDDRMRGGRVVKFNQSNPQNFSTQWLGALDVADDQPELFGCDL